MNKQTFKVPADQLESSGLFIAGGWHNFHDSAAHGKVLMLPEVADHAHLGALGFTQVPNEPEAPVVAVVADAAAGQEATLVAKTAKRGA